jgi:hypothetical protein
MPVEVLPIQRARALAAVAAEVHAPSVHRAMVAAVATVVPDALATSLALSSSLAAAVAAAEPPPVLVNMVAETVRRQVLETMVWTTLAAAQVHQQREAASPRVAMALSLFATHPLLWIQRRQL